MAAARRKPWPTVRPARDLFGVGCKAFRDRFGPDDYDTVEVFLAIDEDMAGTFLIKEDTAAAWASGPYFYEGGGDLKLRTPRYVSRLILSWGLALL